MAYLAFTDFATKVLGLRLTPAQFVLARVVFDQADPCELSDEYRGIARRLFGDVDVIPAEARRVLVLRCGRNSGKTTLATAFGIYRMCVADTSQCGPGDRPAVVAIAPRRETAGIALAMALAMVEGCWLKKRFVGKPTAKGFALRQRDGAVVWFVTLPKSRGGAAARGFSIVALLIDESEFVSPTDPASTISDTKIIQSVSPRMLRGGIMMLTSTPWPTPSATATFFDENFGKPTRALAARAPTELMRNFDPEVVANVEAERARDPVNALREFDCLPTDAEGSFFDSATIDAACTRTAPARRARAVAGFDLSFRVDSSANAIVERHEGLVALVHLDMMSPAPGRPLAPSAVLTRFCADIRAAGATAVATDAHYLETAREHATKHGIQVHESFGNVPDRLIHLRELLRDGRIAFGGLALGPELARQLKCVLARPMGGGGLQIVLPRTAGVGHADLVSAVVAACSLDRAIHGPMLAQGRTGAAQASPAPSESVHARGMGFQSW